jgi:hypothetical protein
LLKHAQFCTLSTISLNSTFDRKWKQKWKWRRVNSTT